MTITLRGGEAIVIDDEDYHKVQGYDWRLIYSKGHPRVVATTSSGSTIALHSKLFGYLGPKARPVFKDGNPFNYSRTNVILTHRRETLVRKCIPISHCPWGKCEITPAGNIVFSTRSPECLDCMNRGVRIGKSSYEKCMDLAAKKDWPGWSRLHCCEEIEL